MSSVDGLPGVLANERARGYLAVAIIFPILATLAVVVRTYCRKLTIKRLALDDWLMVVALIFYYCQAAAELVGLFIARWGTHVVYTTPYEQLVSYKLGVLLTLAYVAVITNVRCSLSLLFLKIFVDPIYRRLAIANLVLNIIYGIYSILIAALRCSPVAATYDTSIPGSCLGQTAVYVSIAIFSVVCNVITWALPASILWRLHMPTANRTALSLIFCLGLVVITISIVQAVASFNTNHPDATYTATSTTTWAYAEAFVAIICACAPTFQPLFDPLLTRLHPQSSTINPKDSVNSFSTTSTSRIILNSKEKQDNISRIDFLPQQQQTRSFSTTAEAIFDSARSSRHERDEVMRQVIMVERDVSITHESV